MSDQYGSSPYEHPPTEGGNPGGPPQGKIFIGGLSPSVTAEGLIAHFSAYGEVVDATIMNDKITGRPRGFGFVTFRTVDAVDALMEESHVLDGKQVECKRAVPMGYLDKPPMSAAGMMRPGGAPTPTAPPTNQRYNPEKIFVGGLPVSCDDSKLREYFSKYGVIVDAVVMIDRDLQRHRGFGYVLFQDASAVDAAVGEHESHQIDGKWVDVKRCVVQDNSASWPAQSGPMRKGYGGKGMGGGMQAPMPGSATMPGYYARPAGGAPAYGASAYGAAPAASYYGGYKPQGATPGYAPAGKGTGSAYGMPGGYMTTAPSAYGAHPQSAYGYGPADPYASSGYGGQAAGPSPYGAMPGYASSGYGGYGAAPAAGAAPSAYGAAYSSAPANPTAANPNDVYAASRRSGYRTSPY
jgi:RNA-binding protein Musashi